MRCPPQGIRVLSPPRHVAAATARDGCFFGHTRGWTCVGEQQYHSGGFPRDVQRFLTGDASPISVTAKKNLATPPPTSVTCVTVTRNIGALIQSGIPGGGGFRLLMVCWEKSATENKFDQGYRWQLWRYHNNPASFCPWMVGVLNWCCTMSDGKHAHVGQTDQIHHDLDHLDPNRSWSRSSRS